MRINGYWFPAGASARHNASLHFQGERFILEIEDRKPVEGAGTSLGISRRVGNIPRKVTFEDKSVFETLDNDRLDRWANQYHPGGNRGTWIHRFESKWRWVGAGVLLAVVFAFASVHWVLPWASDTVADHLPHSVAEEISDGTLALLDQVLLEPSEIAYSEQQRIARHFDNLLVPADAANQNYRLSFRKLGQPNAFALPSGEIIVTDALVTLVQDQRELDSVILHEIGHVAHRHGLKLVARSSFIAVAVAMLIGDPGGVEEAIIALPVILLQSHYSRGYEAEADEYAFKQMLEVGIDPIYFARILKKMEQSLYPAEQDDSPDAASPGEIAPGDNKSVFDYLQTHPATPERISAAIRHSERYRQISH